MAEGWFHGEGASGGGGTTTVADTFNRTSTTTLGTTTTGSRAWTAQSGTWGTDSANGYMVLMDGTIYANMAYVDVGATDGLTEVTIVAGDQSAPTGVMARMGARSGLTTLATGYSVRYDPGRGSGLWIDTNTGTTVIAGFTVNIGDRVGIQIVGTLVQGYVNGVLKGSSITSTPVINTTATHVGLIGGRTNVGGTITASKFDNFAFTPALSGFEGWA